MMYSSPLAVASREAKKLSSKIKSQVSNFDKLVTSWIHNCSEVSDLLFKLGKNCDSMESVRRASKNSQLASVKAIFPDLFEKLIGNLLVEIEDICLQIKVFMRILRDVNTAMQLQAYECSSIVTSYSTLDTVYGGGDDAAMIMATEDILSLQQKYYQHNQQLVHKEHMIKDLLAKPSSSHDNVDAYWLQKPAVVEVLASW